MAVVRYFHQSGVKDSIIIIGKDSNPLYHSPLLENA